MKIGTALINATEPSAPPEGGHEGTTDRFSVWHFCHIFSLLFGCWRHFDWQMNAGIGWSRDRVTSGHVELANHFVDSVRLVDEDVSGQRVVMYIKTDESGRWEASHFKSLRERCVNPVDESSGWAGNKNVIDEESNDKNVVSTDFVVDTTTNFASRESMFS